MFQESLKMFQGSFQGSLKSLRGFKDLTQGIYELLAWLLWLPAIEGLHMKLQTPDSQSDSRILLYSLVMSQ